MCEMKSMTPSVAFFNKSVPTVPMMNIGPELEQKLLIRYADVRSICPFS